MVGDRVPSSDYSRLSLPSSQNVFYLWNLSWIVVFSGVTELSSHKILKSPCNIYTHKTSRELNFSKLTKVWPPPLGSVLYVFCETSNVSNSLSYVIECWGCGRDVVSWAPFQLVKWGLVGVKDNWQRSSNWWTLRATLEFGTIHTAFNENFDNIERIGFGEMYFPNVVCM